MSRPPLRMYHCPRRDDLERPVAALVELHRVLDGPRVADQQARLDELLGHDLLGLLRGEAGDLRVGVGVDAVWRVGVQPAVATDDRSHRQVQFTPPGDVGGVAEGADHCDARALVRLGELVGAHLDLLAVERHGHRGAEQGLVALVVGVSDERDAGRQQLGASGVDLDRPAAVGTSERDLVVGARCARGPPSRLAPRPCGSRCPTASVLPGCRPRRGRRCGGTPAGWRAATVRRWSRTGATSRPTGRGA